MGIVHELCHAHGRNEGEHCTVGLLNMNGSGTDI
jgi:hypothetical protein